MISWWTWTFLRINIYIVVEPINFSVKKADVFMTGIILWVNNRSPVWAILLNYEVVQFQASVRGCYVLRLFRLLLTNFILPLPPYLSQPFLYLSIFPPPPTAPTSAAICRCNTYWYTRSPPPIPEQSNVHLAVAHAYHPPASVARIYAPLHVPASATVSRVHSPPSFPP